MVDVAPQAAAQVEVTARQPLRPYYVLALLTVIYALNFLDRTIFNVLIEPIKRSSRSATPRWDCWQASASCCSIRCSAFPSPASPIASTAATSWRLGPVFAIAQTVAKPSMRARASAIMLLMAAGFGQGIGPLAVGMLNDALKNVFGAHAVRYSLLSASVTSVLGALLFIWAARSIRGDIQRAG